jgi:cobaltochelatase CobT
MSTAGLVERVTGAALRSVSGRRGVHVAFGEGGAKLRDSGDSAEATLPSLDRPPDAQALRALRGQADLFALRLRYQDPALYRRQRPGGAAGVLFDGCEHARLLAIGTKLLAGSAGNIAAYEDLGFVAGSPQAMSFAVREALTGRASPPGQDPALVAALQPRLLELRGALSDQQRFGTAVLSFIADLGLTLGVNEDASEKPAIKPRANPREQGPGADLGSLGDPPAYPDRTRAEAAQPGLDRLQEYHAYAPQFDRIVTAEEICSAHARDELRASLDRQFADTHDVVMRLANRLQRKLMARQRRWWEFDLEEGILDAGRLARVIADPRQPLAYKAERSSLLRETVVTLLIDNSGSMRGRPIALAAMTADIMARTLERCGVKVEVLGFTTRGWQGGESRSQWIRDGRPPHPGRLNDALHIVYKSADVPLRRARANFGVMLRDGLLKENIDGEALLWAHARLSARPEPRRILMVISDGAPVDDATLAANGGDYLERHLGAVIRFLETRTPVELIAIGINHDVTSYYRRAIRIGDAEELGGTVLRSLLELFDSP